MIKIMRFVLFFSLVIITTSANASIRAYLAYDDYECKSDHMIFETPQGYILAEWYSGTLHSPYYFYADFHSYGFKDVYGNEEDAENDENTSGRIYIEDYMVSSNAAANWCY
jgi:hypothetical protein